MNAQKQIILFILLMFMAGCAYLEKATDVIEGNPKTFKISFQYGVMKYIEKGNIPDRKQKVLKLADKFDTALDAGAIITINDLQAFVAKMLIQIS